jgi:1-acyl-sn-glycerol-3-phosphate acyltransferase
MDRLAEAVMTTLARLLVRVFFRGIEVEGTDHLRADRPVVLVANHTNGLVDGLLLMATLPRYPRFLGKSTLFKIPPLWPFMKLARVIPVFRQSDGAAGHDNDSAFSTCHAILARRGLVALFPEGISHDETSLQPLRTGAARIALEAATERGVTDVEVVAVGLTYDAKARFRSRALVRIGQPVVVAELPGLDQADDHEAVRQFTAVVADMLAVVSPPFASWLEVEQLSRIAQVVVRPPHGSLPQDVALHDQSAVAEQLAAMDDPLTAALRQAYQAYARDLELLGLGDDQVVASYPRGKLRRTLAWALLKVVVTLPFAVLGVAVHLVPFQFMKWVSRRPANEGVKATVKLLGCFVLFAMVYALAGVLVGRAFGSWLGLAAALAAPVCGYAAVRMGERLQRIGGLLEGHRIVSDRRRVLATVTAHRDEVVQLAGAILGPS